MSERKYLNNDWKFTEDAATDAAIPVRIPHTCKEFPYHCFDESACQMKCKYERALYIFEEWKEKVLLLTFEGAAHEATLLINNQEVYVHRCGYTAFTVDISEYVEYGKSNQLTLVLDTRETLDIPPFGNHSDIMAYGGIYRDVYLEIKEPSFIRDVFVRTRFQDGKAQAISKVKIEHKPVAAHIRQSIRRAGSDQDFTDVGYVSADKGNISFSMAGIRPWNTENPTLYEIRTELLSQGQVIDTFINRIGFRQVEFREDGFYLNGERMKLRGLARSQAYPYVGYAMPDSMQAYDADILKFELGVNAVRSAKYPASKAFLDRCDELGLLVFDEVPGSKYAGNVKWKNQELEDVKETVLQNRNHPSIVLWGIPVSDEIADEDFYQRMTGLIHKLDPDRKTAGVCTSEKDHIHQDVFAYDDFTCDTEGHFRKKSEVTSQTSMPYLISSFGGPVLPTKSYDCESHRMKHALLYSKALQEADSRSDICGSFGFCMTDFNAHKNYGSGDRVCYHGVMDMFRNPKLAAAAYRVYQKEKPVLELSSALTFGENPLQSLGDVYIYTNGDAVRMYRNDIFIREYPVTDHMPVLIDDFVGNILENESDFTPEQQEEIRKQLNHRARTGKFLDIKKGLFDRRTPVSRNDLNKLYEKYILGISEDVPKYRFDALRDGSVIASITRLPMKMHDLEIRVSSLKLKEVKAYDVASVRFRALDENGNILPFANNPLALKAEGSIELIGPKFITLQGGMGGTYVRTCGKKGHGKLLISGLQNLYGSPKEHRGEGIPYNNLTGGRGYEVNFDVE